MTTTAPYGSWASPITASLITQASVGLGGPAFSAGDLWWSELRPQEQGRVQLVRKGLDAPPEAARDVLPDGFAARTRVHEYGGGAWWLHEDTLFFANWDDQRLYRIDHAGTDEAGEPVPLTPEPETKHALRYADGDVTPDGHWIVCVRESHGVPGTTEARNELVLIATDGSFETWVLVGGDDGPDFVSNPRISPNGHLFCWLRWDHPNLPWDETELWVANLAVDDVMAELVVGGDGVSIAQPTWEPDSGLMYCTDQDGEWHPNHFLWGHHKRRPRPQQGQATHALCPTVAGEFAEPQWVFGLSDILIDDAGAVTSALRVDGVDQLYHDLFAMDEEWNRHRFTSVDGLTEVPDGVAFIGATFSGEPEVVTVAIEPPRRAGRVTVHRPARDLGISTEWFSQPESITFPTEDLGTGVTEAHALYYPPTNPEHVGPDDERPPLLVLSHGGPTSAARPMLQLSIQYWTSRGFGVVDVNYRGSTGYGRAYRDALKGQWGIVDVADCVAAAQYLVARGDVDGERLVIRGGSAGGYTTLCALTFTDVFAAGGSLYGVADLEALAKDTHKFESRYLDGLVAPYPEGRDVYVERSPIHHVDQLSTPIILLQGLEDEIVPPSQAEMMVAALGTKGVPHAYLAFEGEQHGFRKAETIERALEAELYFYAHVLGFELAEPIEPIEIKGDPWAPATSR